MNRSMARLTMLAMALALTPTATVRGVTPLPSADGQFWDIRDTSVWAQDSGGIATGGRANPFNGFGYLKLRVSTPAGVVLRNQYLRGFGLSWDSGDRFDSVSPVLADPSGVIGGRYPFGISLLGPMWSDRRLLELGAAYERIAPRRVAPVLRDR